MLYNTAPFESISSMFSNSAYTNTVILVPGAIPNSRVNCNSPACLGLRVRLSACPMATLSNRNSVQFLPRHQSSCCTMLPCLHQVFWHYDAITTLPGFFSSSYVCAHCFKTYNDKGRHRCKIKIQCRCCLQKDCPDFLHAYPSCLKASQRCHECGRDFLGDTSFDAHRSKTA